MEGAFSNGMCRCCASEGMEGTFKNVSSKYHWMGEEEIYADMLRECFDITLTSASNKCQEGGICEVCITQLRNASNFKKQVLHTEILFKKKLQNYMFKTNIVKVEVSPLDDAGNASDNNLSDDLSGPEYDIPIKTEAEEPKTKKRGKATPASKAKKPKVEDAETSTKSTRIIKREMKTRAIFRPRLTIRKESRSNSDLKLSELEKHRANFRTILMCSNATPIRCQGERGYACAFCLEQFPDPAVLKAHTIQSHDERSIIKLIMQKKIYDLIIKLDITMLRCKLCDISIDTLDTLTKHLIEKHDKKIYAVANTHILPFKFEDNRTMRCVVCSNVYNKFKLILQHMNTHYRNYVCEVCDGGYVNRCMLTNHVGVHKKGVFKCKDCDKVFDTHRKMKSHEKYVHIHFNMLSKCGHCNLKFKDHRRKEEHMAKVHGAILELKCQACSKILPNQRALAIHTKRDHLMERSHKCRECDMTFFKACELKDHLVKHTGEKTFQCSICLKSYGRKKTLVEHMKIHTNDRRFKCEHCKLSFIQKCSLTGHIKAKHREKDNKD